MGRTLICAVGMALAMLALAANAAFDVTEVADFDKPWAFSFLPDGRILVTEKDGRLFVVTQDGAKAEITGVPDVAYGGQGGFGDIVLHPDYATNSLVYFSYAEAGTLFSRGAVVARARLKLSAGGGSLEDAEIVWLQEPKIGGQDHYGHRIAFSEDGYLFISSGDRDKIESAQVLDVNLGKILRLHDDGSVPDDNPFADQGGVTAQIWSYGHRNPLGIDFDAKGRLWNSEMGPQGGDELNLVVRGANYGWPEVSQGSHYSGIPIPNHDTRPEFEAPKVFWLPSISPASLLIYTGDLFPDWKGDVLLTGLSFRGLVHVRIDGDTAEEQARFDMGSRMRGIRQGPDGAVWVIQDGARKAAGRLLKLTPT